MSAVGHADSRPVRVLRHAELKRRQPVLPRERSSRNDWQQHRHFAAITGCDSAKAAIWPPPALSPSDAIRLRSTPGSLVFDKLGEVRAKLMVPVGSKGVPRLHVARTRLINLPNTVYSTQQFCYLMSPIVRLCLIYWYSKNERLHTGWIPSAYNTNPCTANEHVGLGFREFSA
jgi:hypothetical protein